MSIRGPGSSVLSFADALGEPEDARAPEARSNRTRIRRVSIAFLLEAVSLACLPPNDLGLSGGAPGRAPRSSPTYPHPRLLASGPVRSNPGLGRVPSEPAQPRLKVCATLVMPMPAVRGGY